MRRRRGLATARGALALLIATPASASATTLPEAIALALKNAPALRAAQAERDAAHARLIEARAGGLPSVTLSGSAAADSTDFGPFFGYGLHSLTPRNASVAISQPIYSGGAVGAAVGRARAGETRAGELYASARLGLIADTAEAYLAVRTAQTALALRRAQAADLLLVRDQAKRRFEDGEIPRSGLDQAEARLAAAQAGLAQGEGDLARARARYRALVGEEAGALDPPGEPPATPASLDEAVGAARAGSPDLAAADAQVRAAEAAIRAARAEGAPSLALTAQASTVRDQFFPGYQADSASIGVAGRWALFSGGLVAGKVSEARAQARLADAQFAATRNAVEEAAIDAWQARRTAESVALASEAQAKAARSALDSVREEVRVGERPTIDLLDAERDALAADLEVLQARAARLVAAYRLDAVIGRDPTAGK